MPTDVTDCFTSQKYNTDDINKHLFEKITDLRDSITNLILEADNVTENQNFSKFDEFTTYMNSNSEKFHCYISVWKFLLKEFAKYYIPFLSDLPKVELIVYEYVQINETVHIIIYNNRSIRC